MQDYSTSSTGGNRRYPARASIVVTTVLILLLLLVGFAAAAVVFAYVFAAIVCRFADEDGKDDLKVRQTIRYGCAYLACYTGIWWISLKVI